MKARGVHIDEGPGHYTVHKEMPGGGGMASQLAKVDHTDFFPMHHDAGSGKHDCFTKPKTAQGIPK
jgi:hypothetical protein